MRVAPLVASVPLMFGSVTAAEQRAALFWVDSREIPHDQLAAIRASMESMASDHERVAMADQRQDADLIVLLGLGRGTSSNAPERAVEATGGLSPDGATDFSEGAGGSVQVALELLDVLGDQSLFEQRVTASLPLTTGTRIAAPAVRAHLSHIVGLMDTWSAERKAMPTPADFGVRDGERKGLDDAQLGRELLRASVAASRAGFEEKALALAAEAQPLFKNAKLRREEGIAWQHLAVLTARARANFDEANRYAQQAVKIAREVDDGRWEACALVNLGVLEARSGDALRALQVLRSAQRLASQSGDVVADSMARANLAGLSAVRGMHESAAEAQQVALSRLGNGTNDWAATRLQLAWVITGAELDERDRVDTLQRLGELRERARALGELRLQRDVALAEADVRHATTNFRYLQQGELAAMRALKLSLLLEDRIGQTASYALLGAFAKRLGRMSEAAELLGRAFELGKDAGDAELLVETLQLLGEIAPDPEAGMEMLQRVLTLRRERGDLRGQVKTLTDLSRLATGIGDEKSAREHHEAALEALAEYVAQAETNPYAEDIRASFLTVLKSPMTTRTELPPLMDYLRIRHLVAFLDPAWMETSR